VSLIFENIKCIVLVHSLHKRKNMEAVPANTRAQLFSIPAHWAGKFARRSHGKMVSDGDRRAVSCCRLVQCK